MQACVMLLLAHVHAHARTHVCHLQERLKIQEARNNLERAAHQFR